MKKILFIIPTFKTGGFCTSLLSFLSLYDKKSYEIDILVLTHQGIKTDAFKNYNVLPENIFLSSGAYNNHKEEKFFRKWIIIAIKILKKILFHINPEIEWKLFANKYKGYDTIVAFAEGLSTQFAANIPCKNRIAWVHCNITHVIQGETSIKRYTAYYQKFNTIVCVADYIRKVFVDMFPSLNDKTICIYNLSDTELIIERSQEFQPKELMGEEFKIISLGKFSYVKQFSKIPSIAVKIKNRGLKFKWFVLGGIINRDEYDKFCSDIVLFGLEKDIIALGEIQNPYPYLLHSNLLVCTSESEACPMVFIEAKALHVPICTTNFGSASEFVENDVNGAISPIEDIDKPISLFIENQSKYHQIKEAISNYSYNNNDILANIYSIL